MYFYTLNTGSGWKQHLDCSLLSEITWQYRKHRNTFANAAPVEASSKLSKADVSSRPSCSSSAQPTDKAAESSAVSAASVAAFGLEPCSACASSSSGIGSRGWLDLTPDGAGVVVGGGGVGWVISIRR